MLWSRCGLFLLLLLISPITSLLMPPPCPPGCCCPRPGLLVLCESLGLRSLPRSVPLNTSALSVARNQLCNVDHLLRPLSSLQELSLSHNLLPRLPRGLPPSLQSLLLQENRITYITSGSLRQLGNLTRLDLEDNRIRAIQPGALEGLNRLQVLTLRGNKLRTLPLSLPSSLTHLDVSANCISILDLPSLSALVNLQVLNINSNCLRSVPERAFDGLPRLRSVGLKNNRWVCECDILYLYRWLLNGRVKMATDLVCSEPLHLAHRLLLNLSVLIICPQVLTPKERKQELQANSSALDRNQETMETNPGQTNSSESSFQGETSHKISPPRTRLLLDLFSLETLTYEDCLSLNKTQSDPSLLKNTPSLPPEEHRCSITAQYCPTNYTTSAEESPPLLSTHRDPLWPTPDPHPLTQPQDPTVVIALLALLCVLVSLLTLAVLLVLKKVILQRQRVAPGGSG